MAEARGLKALENWAKKVTSGYNGVNVTDMASSFRDGLAFCAIIHHYYPDLIDFESLSKENILHNNSLAFSTAEKQLGIPALLDAEDMVKYAVPDRLSIITYLSQLYNCLENQNRVNRVRPAIKRIQTERPSSPPAKVPLSDQKSAGRSHELCHACKHRVFILERLMVSGKLYHRTCFKCCKCDAILKPGAYIESDNPGTYECAVCPRDEKKRQTSPERKEEQEEQECHKDDTEAMSEVTLVVSPPPKPQRTPLSSKLNSARNTFLQDSMQNGKTEDLPCEASINGEMSSHDSFSMSVDQALDELEGEVEAVTDDQLPEKTSRSSSLSSYGSPEKTPQDSSSTEHADEKEHKPYQSIFTREALHLTPLKSSIVPKEKHPVSSTLNSLYSVGAGKTEIKQSNYDIPFVRPSSQSDAAVTPPRRSSIPGFQIVRSSSTSGSLDKGHSEGSISFSVECTSTVRGFRKGSLGTASADVSAVEDGADCGPLARPGSEQRKSSEDGEVVLRKQTRSSSFSSESSESSKRSQQDPGSRMSVRELIRLREASIHEAATSSPTSSISKKRSDSQLDSKPVEKDSSLPDQDLQSHDDNSREKDDEPDQGIIIKAADEAKVDDKVPNTSDSAEKSFEESHKVLNSSGSEQTSGEVLTEPSGTKSEDQELYPDELNPFGDEDCDAVTDSVKPGSYPDTLNPFGDDDEDDNDNSTSVGKAEVGNDDYDDSKNPFASDDDDDGEQASIPVTKPELSKPPPRPPLPTLRTSIIPKSPQHSHSSPSLSSMDSPTGSIVGTHKKRKAPQPPHVKELFPNDTSDASPSPTAGAVTPTKLVTSPSPKILKSKRAPPPPSPATSVKSKDFTSLNSISAEKFKKDEANMKAKSTDSLAVTTPKSPSNSQDETQSSQWKKKKRPAPPVPIPSRREIKKIPLHEIQAEMNEIEEKQIELEKQGRDLEVLIRDRDKDEEPTVEEEEYIMQLFELVNQKNALFRRQAELMYIKRSQRLEEEQVELEYEIRCLMMKPASQKTDEDKAKEEHLVQRLLDVVDQRNEIIDSIEMDRKREFEEDVTVQEQMEIKNSDLPITAEIKKKQKKKKKNKEESKIKKEKKKKEKEQQQSVKQQHGESGGSKLKTLLRR